MQPTEETQNTGGNFDGQGNENQGGEEAGRQGQDDKKTAQKGRGKGQKRGKDKKGKELWYLPK